MKKIIYICICLTIILSLFNISFANTYTDINNSKYINAIEQLIDIKVFEGYPDNTFLPENNITRAEVCKIIVNTFKLNNSNTNAVKFSDVDNNHWAYSYIQITSSNGCIKGYPDGKFKSDDNISCEEVVTIIIRSLGYNLDSQNNWPTNYIEKAKELGIFTNVNNISFSDKIDRQTVAQILWDSINIRLEDGYTIFDKNFKEEEPQYDDLQDYTLEYGIVTSDIMYTNEDSKIEIFDVINEKTFVLNISNIAGIQKGTILKFTKLLGTNEYVFNIIPNTYQVIENANQDVTRIFSDGKYVEFLGTDLAITSDAKIFYINSQNEVDEVSYGDISNFDIIYPLKGKEYSNGIIYNIIIAREYSVSL